MCCSVVIVWLFSATMIAAIAMPLLQPFNQILRGFFKALAGIELVCPGAARMAMHFQKGAAWFAGQAGGFCFEPGADAAAAGVLIDGEVADARKITFEGQLG